jgi:hypothetical protein
LVFELEGDFRFLLSAASLGLLPSLLKMRDDDFSLIDDDATDGELPVFDMGAEHWQEEIDFLERRLRGEQGDIDKDDKETCTEALAIAKGNLANCLRLQK